MSDSLVDTLIDENSQGKSSYFDTSEPASSILSTHINVLPSGDLALSEDGLRKIGVQYDHNMTVVQFKCPRYYAGKDLRTFEIWINYERSDFIISSAKCQLVSEEAMPSEEIDQYIYFNWIITKNVTAAPGTIRFLVCFKLNDSSGNELYHINTELYNELYISEGLESSKQTGGNTGDDSSGNENVSDNDPVKIISTSITPDIVARGSTVSSVKVNWEVSKLGCEIWLEQDGTAVTDKMAITNLSGTITLSDVTINANSIFTLHARDTISGDEDSSSVTLSIGYYVYYGAAEYVDTVDKSFIETNFTKSTLLTTKIPSIEVDAGENKYVYYCQPVIFGSCSFKWISPQMSWVQVFDKLGTIIIDSVTYDIYRSPSSGLNNPGETTKYEIY